jgi:hypothetical protein
MTIDEQTPTTGCGRAKRGGRLHAREKREQPGSTMPRAGLSGSRHPGRLPCHDGLNTDSDPTQGAGQARDNKRATPAAALRAPGTSLRGSLAVDGQVWGHKGRAGMDGRSSHSGGTACRDYVRAGAADRGSRGLGGVLVGYLPNALMGRAARPAGRWRLTRGARKLLDWSPSRLQVRPRPACTSTSPASREP